MNWIKSHKGIVIAIVAVLVVIIAMFSIRSVNMKKKANNANTEVVDTLVEPPVSSSIQQDVAEDKEPTSSYQAQLGLNAEKDDRVTVEEKEEVVEDTEPIVQTEPKYSVDINIWDFVAVPDRAQDGSSFKSYFSKVKLSNFGTKWGRSLTEDDFIGGDHYLVGSAQNPDAYIRFVDLQSAGWVMDNIDTFNDNDCFTFTNLHVIGSLSDSHVALLCVTDWYSAYGLKDMLVVFEDISDTLNVEDFKPGDIFSCSAFKHNIKVVEKVSNQRVLVVEYATY